jgi:16S rRNA (adenine1518-N6/adenine1519-N6)-dimethyltransferase
MIPIPKKDIPVNDEQLFAKIVMAAFGQRRKTLRNTLRGYLAEIDFTQLDLDSQLRAENLGYMEYARISNWISARHGPK